MTWILLTKIIVITIPVLLIIYDIFAYWFGGLEATISQVIRKAGSKNPLIAALVGAFFVGLIIHFFQ